MKKWMATVVAFIMTVNTMALGVFALDSDNGIKFEVTADGNTMVYDNKDKDRSKWFKGPEVTGGESFIETAPNCEFNKTYYFALDLDDAVDGKSPPIPSKYLADENYFKFSVDKDKNGTYLDGNITFTSRMLGGTRYDVIKVPLKDAGVTEEKEISFTVYFRARKEAPDSLAGAWSDDDVFSARFRLWAENPDDDSGDADVEAGDSVVFKPNKNDDNVITWGKNYEVASLEFKASSDADDFYAKVSTKANGYIYDEYGTPANAELFFRTFSGDHIDAVSRGTLTLYNPWYDDGYDYAPNPRDIYIYRVINGRELEDITDQFTYVREDDTPCGIDGWQTRTRVLDAYVISDKPLDDGYWDDGGDDNDYDYEDNSSTPPTQVTPPDNTTSARPLTPEGNNPNYENVPSTGDFNFVPIAILAGILSLGALGFALWKKKHTK